MRICFVIGSLSFSGAEKVLSAITDKFAEKGNEVYIILLEGENKVEKYKDNIITYGAKSTGNRVKRILKRMRLINKHIKDINPDIVVSFGYVCNINCSAALLFSNKPLILCERNDPNYDPRGRLKKIMRNVLYFRSTGIVFQTKDIENYFKIFKNKKNIVIPNPVIDINIEGTSLFNNSKKIITVARLDDYQKNQSMLIKGFANISDKIPDYKLYIYGKGPDKVKYERLIDSLDMNDKILLCGPTINVKEVLNNKEIFVLTSKFEGMPNALIEAMSFGLPCISTDCGGGGAKALIHNMKNGILIEENNQKQLEEKLVFLAENNELKKQISKNALNLNNELCIDKISDKWIEYFNTIIN